MKMALTTGADPHATNAFGFCSLSIAAALGREHQVESTPSAPDTAQAVVHTLATHGAQAVVAAAIELCAQAQLGMTYSDHAKALTVGTAVTWTSLIHTTLEQDHWGTIVKVGPSGTLRVEGATSGKRAWFNPGSLRLHDQETAGSPTPTSPEVRASSNGRTRASPHRMPSVIGQGKFGLYSKEAFRTERTQAETATQN
jgi:hypothetical protein